MISITSGKKLFALLKTGELENAAQNGAIEETQWKHIVQTTAFFDVTNVALRADGTVVVGDISDQDWQDGWLKDVADWENIVLLSAEGNEDPAGTYSALVGLDANGNVYLCDKESYEQSFMDHQDVFKDIKTIDISVGVGSSVVNAVALRNDGKLITYIDGEISIADAEDIVDVRIADKTIYKLSSNGKLYKNNSQSVVLTDVVALFDDYLITRSGTIYSIGETIETTGVKGPVYNEWLARMD